MYGNIETLCQKIENNECILEEKEAIWLIQTTIIQQIASCLKTGKLDSNQEELDGIYPFFTCAPNPSRINSFSFDQKAILLAGNNANGNFHINYFEGKFDAYQRTYVISVLDEEKLDLKYLYYALKICLNDFKRMSQGTSTRFLTKKILDNFEIQVPPIETQLKIVNLLDNLTNKIEVNNQLNHNLEQLAKSIYKHHFIDMKPYMLGGYIRESPLGIIPKDWSVQLIGEFVDDMKNGGTPRRGESAYWENGTIPWLKTGEINNNIILKSEEHITELGLKNSSAKLLPKNSIIMALYGKGTAARIGLLKIEATTNQACCAMICNDLNKTLFLYLFLLFNQKEIENLASGSVQQNLSKDLIANLNLIVPPIEIIENLPFKEIFDTIANNYFEIEYLTNLRDTLLPKLMSGEVDVSKINCDL